MKLKSTFLLKGALIIIGSIILALCIFIAVMLVREGVGEDYAILIPIVVVMYAAAIPFFLALYETWKLVLQIDTNQAFSEVSVKRLQKIKYCAVGVSAVYVIGLPFLYQLAQGDDAPGVIMLGLIIIFASAVIAVFAAVLQQLLKNAIDLKSENELTV